MSSRAIACVLVLAALFGAAPAAHAVKPYDLNGDGRQDLVIGFPNWENSEGEEVGALVAFGAKRGLIGKPRSLTRAALRIPPGDRGASIGASIASGDFDGDGRADLALGVPGIEEYESGSYESRGAVAVAYGGRRFPRRTALIRGPKADHPTGFGNSLVAGDTGRDGLADLIAGPGDFKVFPGGEAGLRGTRSSTIESPPGAGYSEETLALGNTTASPRAELFQGGSGRQIYDEPRVSGNVAGVFDGASRAEWVAEEMEAGGPWSMALGDVNGDGYRDLVAGVPHNYRTEYPERPPGAVLIWWGRRDRLSAEPTTLTQDSPGVPGTTGGTYGSFGWSVAVGRLDRDRYADIVVGHPYEDDLPDGHPKGRVTIIRGGPNGYSQSGNRSFGFDTRGVPGSVRRGDRYFGFWLSLLDFNGDRNLDLAVDGNTGTTILRGSRRGISPRGGKRVVFDEAGVTTGTRTSGPNPGVPLIGRAGSSR